MKFYFISYISQRTPTTDIAQQIYRSIDFLLGVYAEFTFMLFIITAYNLSNNSSIT